MTAQTIADGPTILPHRLGFLHAFFTTMAGTAHIGIGQPFPIREVNTSIAMSAVVEIFDRLMTVRAGYVNVLFKVAFMRACFWGCAMANSATDGSECKAGVMGMTFCTIPIFKMLLAGGGAMVLGGCMTGITYPRGHLPEIRFVKFHRFLSDRFLYECGIGGQAVRFVAGRTFCFLMCLHRFVTIEAGLLWIRRLRMRLMACSTRNSTGAVIAMGIEIRPFLRRDVYDYATCRSQEDKHQ